MLIQIPQYNQDGPNEATEAVLAGQPINAATKEYCFRALVSRDLSERIFRSALLSPSAWFFYQYNRIRPMLCVFVTKLSPISE